MRNIILLLFLTSLAAAQAQVKQRTFKTDSGTVVIHYFGSGQVSTREWMDQDNRWGRSWAYTKSGSVIVEHQTRRIAGHSSVHYQYHPNGAISKAEYSTAPDAGIHWEQGHDDRGIIPNPRTTIKRAPDEPEPVVQPLQQEVVEEQRLFVNELLVVNPTNAAVRVVAAAKHPSPALPGGTWTMAPGDTVRIGAYTMGEAWPDWKEHVELAITQVVLGDRNHAAAMIRTDEAKQSTEHRKLFVVIEGWATTKAPVGQEHLPGLGEPETKKKKRRWLFFR
jgi:hypothetical protein